MKFSITLYLISLVIFVKVAYSNDNSINNQERKTCPSKNLHVAITSCTENEVLLKNNKKIYFYYPPNEDEDDSCDRTSNLESTSLEECAPVQLFKEPNIITITSFSNAKFDFSKYLDIKCSLENDSKNYVKDCKGWKINENNLTIGDITTTDKSLIGQSVNASITLNIKVEETIENKIVIFSFNSENGFKFLINNKDKLTLTPNEPDIKKTFGYASLLDKNSTSITWSFTSKLKEEGKADNDKAITMEGASIITPEDKESPTRTNLPSKTDESFEATPFEEEKDKEITTTSTVANEDIEIINKNIEEETPGFDEDVKTVTTTIIKAMNQSNSSNFKNFEEENEDTEDSNHRSIILLSAGTATVLFFYMKSKRVHYNTVSEVMKQLHERSDEERFDYFAEEGFLEDYDNIDEVVDDDINISIDDDDSDVNENVKLNP
ncbi:hypothetical protein H8356DRAFT_1285371 [Neocallimastix lanati (nom. inval.)]|nr:hypothetical protein H8356DRAFT_1285371 [Neocallimastix sp. JGI-2020a]